MAHHAAEPPFAHDRTPRIGVLLSTSARPTPPRRRRCVAIWRSSCPIRASSRFRPWAWKPILHGVILLRAAAPVGRASTRAIWTRDGSPLLVHSVRQRTLLLGYLGQRLKSAGLPADLCPVELGMRYGNAVASAARSTSCGPPTARKSSCCRSIRNTRRAPRRRPSTPWPTHLAHVRRLPALRFVETFHDDPGYIKALAQIVNDYWMKHGRPDQLVLSFHGVPRAHARARRSLPLLLPEDGAAARPRARPRGEPVGAHLPVALRPRRMADSPTPPTSLQALGAGQGRGGWTCSVRASSPIASRRSRRSPSRARRRFRRGRRRRFPRHPLPQRASGVDRRPGRPRLSQPAGLAGTPTRHRRARANDGCAPRRSAPGRDGRSVLICCFNRQYCAGVEMVAMTPTCVRSAKSCRPSACPYHQEPRTNDDLQTPISRPPTICSLRANDQQTGVPAAGHSGPGRHRYRRPARKRGDGNQRN